MGSVTLGLLSLRYTGLTIGLLGRLLSSKHLQTDTFSDVIQSAVSSHSEVRDGTPAANAFLVYLELSERV